MRESPLAARVTLGVLLTFGALGCSLFVKKIQSNTEDLFRAGIHVQATVVDRDCQKHGLIIYEFKFDGKRQLGSDVGCAEWCSKVRVGDAVPITFSGSNPGLSQCRPVQDPSSYDAWYYFIGGLFLVLLGLVFHVTKVPTEAQWTETLKSLRHTLDANVVAAWSERCNLYRKKTRWLWAPTLASVAVVVIVPFLLGQSAFPSAFVVAGLGVIAVGAVISRFTPLLLCPHCGRRPIKLGGRYRTPLEAEYCEHCRYWLRQPPTPFG